MNIGIIHSFANSSSSLNFENNKKQIKNKNNSNKVVKNEKQSNIDNIDWGNFKNNEVIDILKNSKNFTIYDAHVLYDALNGKQFDKLNFDRATRDDNFERKLIYSIMPNYFNSNDEFDTNKNQKDFILLYEKKMKELIEFNKGNNFFKIEMHRKVDKYDFKNNGFPIEYGSCGHSEMFHHFSAEGYPPDPGCQAQPMDPFYMSGNKWLDFRSIGRIKDNGLFPKLIKMEENNAKLMTNSFNVRWIPVNREGIRLGRSFRSDGLPEETHRYVKIIILFKAIAAGTLQPQYTIFIAPQGGRGQEVLSVFGPSNINKENSKNVNINSNDDDSTNKQNSELEAAKKLADIESYKYSDTSKLQNIAKNKIVGNCHQGYLSFAWIEKNKYDNYYYLIGHRLDRNIDKCIEITNIKLGRNVLSFAEEKLKPIYYILYNQSENNLIKIGGMGGKIYWNKTIDNKIKKVSFGIFGGKLQLKDASGSVIQTLDAETGEP